MKLVKVIGPPHCNATVNRSTDWLRHALNWAMKQKRIRKNPVLAIERKPEDEAPIFQYTLAQEAKLVEQLNEEEVDMFRLAILTGLRQGNQFSLRKNQINLGLGIIAIPQSKNRKPRIAHLTEETRLSADRWPVISNRRGSSLARCKKPTPERAMVV